MSVARVDGRTRSFYGVGAVGEGIKNGVFSFFLLFYYNQVLGLSGTLAGFAIASALVFDAVSDPVVGHLSDNLRSRFGRRHPFIFASVVPLSVSLLFLFMPPSSLGETGLFLWLATFSTLVNTFLTFFSVPHMALGAELTSDYHERTLIAATRAASSGLGGVLVLVGGFGIIFAERSGFVDGRFDPAAYPEFGLAVAVAIGAAIFLSGWGTRHTARTASMEGVTTSNQLTREFARAFRLRNFRLLLGALVANEVAMGALSALSVYMLTYFWQLPPSTIQGLLIVSMVGALGGSVGAARVARRSSDKRRVAIAGILWFAFFGTLASNVRLVGLGLEPGSSLVLPAVIGGGLLGSLAIGFLAAMRNSMVADLTDEHESAYGSRQEGVYFSAVSFGMKAAGGLGTALAGLAIDWAGLATAISPDNTPTSVALKLGSVYGPGIILLTGLPVILLSGYALDEERHRTLLRLNR